MIKLTTLMGETILFLFRQENKLKYKIKKKTNKHTKKGKHVRLGSPSSKQTKNKKKKKHAEILILWATH